MDTPQEQPPSDTASALGTEQVLSCFELLRAQQVSLTVETGDGVETEGRVESLDPAKGRMVVSLAGAPGQGLEADDEVDLYFTLQGSRWTGRATVHYHDDRRRRFSMLLPEQVGPADRRRERRVPCDPSENIRAALGLVLDGAGILLSGRVSNLSESGFRMTVELAQDEAAGREMDPQIVPLEEGAALDRVSITGLRSEALETQGRIMDLEPNPMGAVLGVRFKYLKPGDRDFLLSCIRGRAARVQAEPTSPASLLVPSIEAAVESAESLRGPVPPPAEERQDSLKRLKKRLRTILLCMPDGPEEEALAGYLREEGYGQVLAVRSLHQLAAALRAGGIHAVIIDGGLAELDGLELASFIFRARGAQPCAILLAATEGDADLGDLASRAGVDRILDRPVLSPELGPLLEGFLDLKPGERTEEPLPEAPAQALPDPRLKRFKTLGLVMPPGPQRDAVQAFLAAEGFTRVLPAGTVGELAKAARGGALDLALVDWPDLAIPELDIVKFLNGCPFREPPKLVLACAQATSHLAREARIQAVARLLVKPYALDAAFADLLLRVLSGE